MLKVEKGFIAVGYQDKENVRPALDVISDVLSQHGMTPVLCVDDLQMEDPEVSMKQVLERVVQCRLIIVEGSRKRIGVGIEAGVAYSHGKTIIYTHERNVEVSKTLRGISDYEIVYDSSEHLRAQLDQLLTALPETS